ncbi:IS66 family insertion sequence element accessory protein TnpA, partial [Photobacterium leiognathi]
MTQEEKHQHWINIISNQQESGLSVPQFCKQHDINYATFHYWLKKLKQT